MIDFMLLVDYYINGYVMRISNICVKGYLSIRYIVEKYGRLMRRIRIYVTNKNSICIKCVPGYSGRCGENSSIKS